MIFAPDVMPVNMLYKSKETLLMGLSLLISLYKETEIVLQLHGIEFWPWYDEPQNGFYPRISKREHNLADILIRAYNTKQRKHPCLSDF